nr:substrate-binding domain-containing protein [Streptomyces sp. Li-HN-5-13]
MLSLPGAAYLYQGEELGLPEVDDLPDEVITDPIFHRTGNRKGIRDGCRVPPPAAVLLSSAEAVETENGQGRRRTGSGATLRHRGAGGGRRVAGIVFVSGLHADTTADHDRYAKLTGRQVPFVLINGYSEKIAAPFISPDDRAAMWMAVQHLVELGHETIGLAVGQKRYVPVLRKIEGFTAAVQQLTGRTPEQAEELVHHTLFSVEGGHAAAQALLDKGCTAIVCGSDMMALGAIRAVRQRGLTVPQDVSVVGFDDSPLIAFTEPPLTTVRQPVEAMATAAVDALLEEVGGNPTQRSEFMFQPELVMRGSTGAGPRNG